MSGRHFSQLLININKKNNANTCRIITVGFSIRVLSPANDIWSRRPILLELVSNQPLLLNIP